MRFETPLKLHSSQTYPRQFRLVTTFETPLKLHSSQTDYIIEN